MDDIFRRGVLNELENKDNKKRIKKTITIVTDEKSSGPKLKHIFYDLKFGPVSPFLITVKDSICYKSVII